MSVTRTGSPHVVIHASAGSGKTFQLAHCYIRLLARGESPERILATTFTRKAAAEILRRVLVRLAHAAGDPSSRAELAKHIGRRLSADRALAILEGMLRNLHRLQIGTLDSFFTRVAASFTLELGLPPGWSIAEEDTAEELRSRAIRGLLGAGKRAELVTLMRLLSKGEVKRSVCDELQAIVRDLHALQLETSPEAWRTVPRPARLSDERLDRAIAALEALAPAAPRLARAVERDAQHARESDWRTFLRQGLAAKIARGSFTFDRKPIDGEIVEAYRPLIRHAVADRLGRLADRTEAIHGLLVHFDGEYRKLQQRGRALRFEDVTRALSRRGVLERLEDLHYRLDTRVGHLLLDEFQDTSLIQWQVLEPIAREIASHVDGSRTFFCVGDVKQSIYDWRGGVAEILETVDELPGVVRKLLNVSYRSAQPIVDVVNRVFSELDSSPAVKDKYRAAVEAWHGEFSRHSTERAEREGHVQLLTATRAKGADRQKRAVFTAAAAKVAELRSLVPGGSIGVLVRDNDAVARLIFELRQRGISASEEGGVRLTDSPVVAAALSLVRLADHPGDTVAAFHVATSPLGPRIGLTVESGPQDRARVASEIRRGFVLDGYGATVYRWVEQLAPDCDARSLSRLLRLVDAAHAYDAHASLRPRDFVSHVGLLKCEDPAQSDVRVMTFHQAKGLEFDIVLLPDLDRRFFTHAPPVLKYRATPTGNVERVASYIDEDLVSFRPDLRPFLDQYYLHHMRDVLSILYVGMTRAVHALYMIIAPANESERTLPGTYAGILRGALAEGIPATPEALLCEHGDPQWFRKTGAERMRAGHGKGDAGPEPRPSGPSEARISLASRGRRRTLVRETPSGLEGASAVRLSDRLRVDNAEALRRGSIVHAWFETIEWIEDGEPDGELLRRRARHPGPAGSARIDALVAEFRGMLARRDIREVLSRGAYLEEHAGGRRVSIAVERERAFAIREGDRILTGSFDRLVTVREGARVVAAEVVDFKTDVVGAEDTDRLDSLVDHYRPQIEAYRGAASRITGLDPSRISARLAFVTAGVTRRLEPGHGSSSTSQ